MAKVLDALERARQERLRREQADRSAAPADPGPADSAEPIPVTAEPAYAPEPPAEDADDGPVAGPAAPGSHAASAAGRLPGEASDLVVGIWDTQSPVTEQVRHIRNNLESVLGDYTSRLLVVSSPLSGDGKTIIAGNLAVVLADSPNHEVVLVDADMRKPDQHSLFGTRQTPGLADYLRGRCEYQDIFHATELPNLRVVPAGRPPRHPTTLLESDRMRELIEMMHQQHQWIVIDTPPLLPVADAAIIARDSLGLVMVVRMGQTPAGVIARAQEQLAEAGLPVLGCILNDYTRQSKEDNYYYKYYGYGKERKRHRHDRKSKK